MSKAPHILVVDDHKEIRESVSRFLERNGMRATAAKDAHEMDAKLALGHFDLIVLDVMMPGESGLSACQRLPGIREELFISATCALSGSQAKSTAIARRGVPYGNSGRRPLLDVFPEH